MKWETCKDAFHTDGSLRDIYVLNTTSDDWSRLFGVFSKYDTTLYCDGDPIPMIMEPATVFERSREHHYFLKVLAEGLGLHCHFFTVEEIEIDFDPNEVSSQRHLNAVLKVMGAIGRALGKRVVLSEENGRDHVWIAFDPNIDGFAYFDR